MDTVLFVKVNPKTDDQSASTTLANYFLDEYGEYNRAIIIEKLDLYDDDIPLLDVDLFSAWEKMEIGAELTPVEREKVNQAEKLLDQFVNADKVIIAAPFWNLSYPPLFKAYIDMICIKDKTFEYTEEGPVGLIPDKSLLLIETRGGYYSEGPAAELEHSQRYLKSVMKFVGIESISMVIAEGLDVDEKHREVSLAKAKAELDVLVSQF